MSNRSFAPSFPRRLAVLLLALGAAGCTAEDAPPPKPARSTALEATLVVHPPEGSRRRAVLRLAVSEPVPTAVIAFGLPADCRAVAGAQRRVFESLAPGADPQSFILFECPAGTSGEISATITGTDGQDRALDQALTASF